MSNYKFDKFDPKYLAMGVMWFAKDKESLVKHLHGAGIRSDLPLYLYQVTTTANNPAGWDEYEKYSTDELETLGFDSVDLDEDFIVFDTNKVKIMDVTMVRDKKN
ncbi:MAG: hypothetical protein ACW987_18555 [Candidatus Thorarchaeota archaeon]